jgi:hypothetical protein
VNVPLIVAGSLALMGAVIHGAGGELLVVRRLSPAGLPSTQFGGPSMTKAMIRASWHLATIAFVTNGSALLLAGSVLAGDTARGVGVVAAAASTGFAALIVGLAAAQAPRALRSGVRHERRALVHPAPLLVTLVTVLAWIGVA